MPQRHQMTIEAVSVETALEKEGFKKSFEKRNFLERKIEKENMKFCEFQIKEIQCATCGHARKKRGMGREEIINNAHRHQETLKEGRLYQFRPHSELYK